MHSVDHAADTTRATPLQVLSALDDALRDFASSFADERTLAVWLDRRRRRDDALRADHAFAIRRWAA